MSDNVAVILAAGMGTRMKSKIPKVLHKIMGTSMLEHVFNILKSAGIEDTIIVLGHGSQEVLKVIDDKCQVVYQQEQLGTGHALLQALPNLENYSDGNCLVICGDTPLLKGSTLKDLMQQHVEKKAKATILTAEIENPFGYGRIIKDKTGIKKIVEEKDASLIERKVKEINTGTYCFTIKSLVERLYRLTPANAQGEYYLTDVIKMLVEDNEKVDSLILEDSHEAMGINNRVQLAEASKIIRKRIMQQLMLEGVTIIDPDNTYIEDQVNIGMDTIIYPGVILEQNTNIGENCIIGPNTRIVNSSIDNGVNISYSCIIESEVGKNCTIGPYSYLRPGSVLADNVKVGDFVEIKKSTVGRGSKVPHLSYVGDSIIGNEVNIGAGTITCNYDGINKHKTYIEDGAFVGSNTNLVAPIKVGKGAYIGAGSTVTKDIPDGALAIARGKQKNIEKWQDKNKEKTE